MKAMVSQRTLRVGQEHELLENLERAGLKPELAQAVINSKGNALARDIVNFIQNSRDVLRAKVMTIEGPAQRIMGNNFFGVRKAEECFRLYPTNVQLGILSTIPFPEAFLWERKDTHILIAELSLSILEIRACVAAKFFDSHNIPAYDREDFARAKGETVWRLICKTPLLNPLTGARLSQQLRYGKTVEVPAATMVYAIIAHQLAIGERLFMDTLVRTSSQDSEFRTVCVGNTARGLLITTTDIV